MKPLPRSLAPWSGELAAFSAEAHALFGSWLPALDRLLGAHEAFDPAGDPDGFSGLGRSGRYERLALSQWGLLDAAPDEFLRRAGSSEHLFHQIARSDRTGGRRLVVLFDAGPAQLGAPRLVHLAWLLVLGRRARSRGVPLRWGILQAPPALREGADAPAVRALLAARSPHPFTATQVSAWRDRLGLPLDAEERWVVSAQAEGAPLSAGSLSVAEPDDPADHLLRVEATPRHGPRARARLPLSDGTSSLLIDPFPREVQAGGHEDIIASGAQVVFSGGGGSHLVARLASGDVVAFTTISKATDARLHPLARFRAKTGHDVIAAGWAKGKMYVATVTDEQRVALHVSHGRHWRTTLLVLPPGLPAPRPSTTTLGLLMVNRRSSRFHFQDASWRVYEGNVEGGHLAALPETVLACTVSQGCLVTLGRIGNGPLATFVHKRDNLQRKIAFESMLRASEGFLCVDGHGHPMLAAVSTGDSTWWLKNLSTDAEVSFALEPGGAVFGTEFAGRTACLLLRSRASELTLAALDGPRETFRLPGQVEHACLQPGGGRLLAAQVNGGLVIMQRSGLVIGRWGGHR